MHQLRSPYAGWGVVHHTAMPELLETFLPVITNHLIEHYVLGYYRGYLYMGLESSAATPAMRVT